MDLIKTSPFTKLFWIEHQLVPNRIDYNIVYDSTIIGRLDVDQLRNALKHLVQDHLLLNRHLSADEDSVLFWKENQFIFELEYFDSAVHQQAFVERPFNLETGPLYRYGLFYIDEDHYDFLIVHHHVLVDGLSGNELTRLISSYYNGKRTSMSLMTQRQKLEQVFADLNAKVNCLQETQSRTLWGNYLASLPAKNHLSYRSDSKISSKVNDVKEYRFNIDSRDLIGYGGELASSSWFDKFSMAWGVLIAKYARSNTAHIHYPIGIREGARFIYGAHVNTLILPINITKNNSFIKLLNERREFLESARLEKGHDYTCLPTSEIMQYSGIKELNVGFCQTNLRDKLLEFQDCQVSLNNRYNIDITDSELLLEYQKSKETYRFRLRYRADLFSDEQAGKIPEEYIRLLHNLLANPHKRINELGLLDPEKYRQTGCDQIEKTNSFSNNQTIHRRFEQQASKTPDNIAIVFEQKSLLYRELNARANQLARFIRRCYALKNKKQLMADTLIALCMDSSIDMYIAILATLKAGAAYVPIDPRYPVERIKYIIEDTESQFVLTQIEHKEALTALLYEQEIEVSVDKVRHKPQLLIANYKLYQHESIIDLPQYLSQAADLAYVIYTSGSTGRPKGVLVEHRNVVRLFDATAAKFKFGEQDVWSAFHSYAFDFSVWEIWGALLFGGRLVAVPYWITRSTEDFYQLLYKEKVTVLNQTPSAFYQLIETDKGQPRLSSLRCIVFGGEALNLAALRPWVERYGAQSPELVNMYGITETTVHVTYRRLQVDDILSQQNASLIGRPIADLGVVVLTPEMAIAPVGEVGEMYVAGAGVTRGYLNQSQLTAERFITHPLLEGSRLYRTGDLAIYRADHELEYIGRIDAQVKVRGYRIELGEIENILSDFNGITQAVVQVNLRQGSAGEKYLVAYYVGDENLTQSDIVDYLNEHLPAHMVPLAFMRLEALPLTINGKLDCTALPVPNFVLDFHDYVPPNSELANELCCIWQDLLGLELVGIKDDFFRIGGDSILAIRMIQRIGKTMDTQITAADIFKYKTIERLERFLSENRSHNHFSGELE